MNSLFDHPRFTTDFQKLAQVTLNPERHSATNALVHSEAVARRAEPEALLLRNLGFAHDIGKIIGTTNPSASVDLLPLYGVTDAAFIELVKCHDTNLPWWMASLRGQPPSDKAWRRLAARVNMRLLCLFMVADRVDCPGGWRANQPLVWFLDECQRRQLVEIDRLVLDAGTEGAI
jgi:hypothetical protein